MEEAAMSEDYSVSATLIQYDKPIPLLRGPIPAGLADDPSLGPFVLAFKDAPSWRKAYRETESKINDQCLAGARATCAISALKKCSLPWWKKLLGSKMDLAEKERCEEEEMAKCMAVAKESCHRFAREKCLPAFRAARIDSADLKYISKTPTQDGVSLPECEEVVTNVRGSSLFQASAASRKGLSDQISGVRITKDGRTG